MKITKEINPWHRAKYQVAFWSDGSCSFYICKKECAWTESYLLHYEIL